MNKMVLLASLAALTAPMSAMAQQGFDGTWKLDLASVKEPKPYVLGLKKGRYSCNICEPPFTVPADGAPHPLKGNPYADTVAITVVDDHTVTEADQKGGKTVMTSTLTVGAGGDTASYDFVQAPHDGAKELTGKTLLKRVAAGARGSHAIAGSWQVTSYADFSANGLSQTLKVDGDMLHLSSLDGVSFTAKLDGTDAPFTGNPGVTTVSVIKLGPDKLRETEKRDGKVVSIVTRSLSADGKTMTTEYKDTLNGATVTSRSTKQ